MKYLVTRKTEKDLTGKIIQISETRRCIKEEELVPTDFNNEVISEVFIFEPPLTSEN